MEGRDRLLHTVARLAPDGLMDGGLHPWSLIPSATTGRGTNCFVIGE